MYLRNPLSDGKEGESKENKKFYLYWIIIIIVITTGVSVIILGYGLAGYWENDIAESEANGQLLEVRCERWLQVADSLVEKYDGNTNFTQWSESDRISIFAIEELYQKNCIPTDIEIMSDLKKCTEIYITIEGLIDKMDERHLDTLSEDKQKSYNDNYEEYFNSYCNKIKDEIEKTDEFIEFNRTRLQ